MNEHFIDLSKFVQSERFKTLDQFLTDNISEHKRFTDYPESFNGKASSHDFAFVKFIDVKTTAYTSLIDQEVLSIPGRAQRIILDMPISGNFKISQNGYSEILEPGGLAIFDNILKSSISGVGDGENILMSVPRSTWSKLMSAPILDECFKFDMVSPIARLARHYMTELNNISSDISVSHQSFLARQMIEIMSAAVNECENSTSETAHRKMMVSNIKAFVRNNIGINPIKVKRISQHFGLSSRYIASVFSKSGESLQSYISNVKMQMAPEMLTDSIYDQISIGEIADRLGYYSLSHFSNAFTLRYGMSPSAYRESIARAARD
jgi:AraC-like DNA-binding protein